MWKAISSSRPKKKVKELEAKVEALHAKMELTVVAQLQELHAYVNIPPAPPQVISVTVPPNTHTGDGNKRTGRSIMDTKGFTKTDTFKAGGLA